MAVNAPMLFGQGFGIGAGARVTVKALGQGGLLDGLVIETSQMLLQTL